MGYMSLYRKCQGECHRGVKGQGHSDVQASGVWAICPCKENAKVSVPGVLKVKVTVMYRLVRLGQYVPV